MDSPAVKSTRVVPEEKLPKLKIGELRKFAAAQGCVRPKERWGEKYEIAWGEKRRDVTITPCGKCIPCRAKKERGMKLEPRTITR